MFLYRWTEIELAIWNWYAYEGIFLIFSLCSRRHSLAFFRMLSAPSLSIPLAANPSANWFHKLKLVGSWSQGRLFVRSTFGARRSPFLVGRPSLINRITHTPRWPLDRSTAISRARNNWYASELQDHPSSAPSDLRPKKYYPICGLID